MLVSDKIVKAFNQQIGNEMGASMQYVSIAAHFAAQSLAELAKFYYRQSEEEREHAMKFVRFLIDAEGQVEIPQVAAPRTRFKSALECVELSLQWEKEVTQQIYGLVDLAREENNHIAVRFLDWFVTEQLEEVTTMNTMVDLIKRAGESGLLYVEEHLARRGGLVSANPIGEEK